MNATENNQPTRQSFTLDGRPLTTDSLVPPAAIRTDPDLWSLIQAAQSEGDRAELLRTERIMNNPNRPTPEWYCAQGAHHRDDSPDAGAWTFTTELHNPDCFYSPRPLTAAQQESRDRVAAIAALTDNQRQTMLAYLSNEEAFITALEYARNHA